MCGDRIYGKSCVSSPQFFCEPITTLKYNVLCFKIYLERFVLINDIGDIKYLTNNRYSMNDLGGKGAAINISHVSIVHSPLLSSKRDNDFESSRSRKFSFAVQMNESVPISPKEHTHKTNMLKAQIQEPDCLGLNLSSATC